MDQDNLCKRCGETPCVCELLELAAMKTGGEDELACEICEKDTSDYYVRVLITDTETPTLTVICGDCKEKEENDGKDSA